MEQAVKQGYEGEMAFRGILYDSKELKETQNWDSWLEALFLDLDRQGVILADISISLDIQTNEAFPGGLLNMYGLAAEECLLIAASDKSINKIGDMPIAVLGCEKEKGNITLPQAEIIAEGFEEIDFYFLERVYQRKHGIPWTVIETRRCFLREITLEDLDRLYEIYGDTSVIKYMENLYEDRKAEEEYTKAYIENMYRFYGYGMWVVVEKETGTLIGRAGLNHLEYDGETELELGYAIAREYQHQGYATEVCEGVLDFVDKALEFKHINCMIQKENEVSIHLAEKLGFGWVEEMKYGEKPLQRYRLHMNNWIMRKFSRNGRIAKEKVENYGNLL